MIASPCTIWVRNYPLFEVNFRRRFLRAVEGVLSPPTTWWQTGPTTTTLLLVHLRNSTITLGLFYTTFSYHLRKGRMLVVPSFWGTRTWLTLVKFTFFHDRFYVLLSQPYDEAAFHDEVFIVCANIDISHLLFQFQNYLFGKLICFTLCFHH